jgi:hypothetical protein
MPSSDPIREWFERHREDYCDCVGSPPRAWAEYMSLLLDERDEARKLARQATNGWACYATREVEHDDIARIHRVLDAMEAE